MFKIRRENIEILNRKDLSDFMEQHQDIAKGYVKGDRVTNEALWIILTEKLNSSGPPSNDCNGWKKTWADWKESIARLTGIYRAVDGLVGSKDFADTVLENLLCDSNKETSADLDVIAPSTSRSALENQEHADKNTTISSKKRPCLTPSPDPKRKRSRTPCNPQTPSTQDLNKLLAEENNYFKSIVNLMEEQRDEIRCQNQKLDRLCNILESHFTDRKINDK
ncbi:hypothetical protein CVS40_3537 [Lucilia cuprina]|nr:hypothetical protein CVS40_3537 [Lucilia cuprina]